MSRNLEVQDEFYYRRHQFIYLGILKGLVLGVFAALRNADFNG